MVKASASRAEDPGFDSRGWGFFRVEYSSDLKIGTVVATLPCAARYRISAGTDGPVSVYCDWVIWKTYNDSNNERISRAPFHVKHA